MVEGALRDGSLIISSGMSGAVRYRIALPSAAVSSFGCMRERLAVLCRLGTMPSFVTIAQHLKGNNVAELRFFMGIFIKNLMVK